MRVRPIFWGLLVLTCASVLLFAANIHLSVPATMQVRIDQSFLQANAPTTVELHLTDPQGLPIEQAKVIPDAWMTNMQMTTGHISVKEMGQGNYVVSMQLDMAGPWEISIIARASGFNDLQETLYVHVE
ncbi:MAG TPA: FixH family protein [Ktedonobacteraceae bacterium]|jgi:hypothetical protein|nr:FixH family protein [Ktedonobacteraceae bacterium]